jgi:hypothetical protein
MNTMALFRTGVVALAVALTPLSVQSQTAAPEQRTPASVVARGSAISAARPGGPSLRGTSVFGYLWAADSAPIPNGTLRLRNVVSGRVEATTASDVAGEFTFENLEGGTYVIEYVNEGGKVVAVGHVFSVGQGETVATFVRLGARLPWFSGLFGNTAAAAVSSAASLGVTAVAPTGLAATAGR